MEGGTDGQREEWMEGWMEGAQAVAGPRRAAAESGSSRSPAQTDSLGPTEHQQIYLFTEKQHKKEETTRNKSSSPSQLPQHQAPHLHQPWKTRKRHGRLATEQPLSALSWGSVAAAASGWSASCGSWVCRALRHAGQSRTLPAALSPPGLGVRRWLPGPKESPPPQHHTGTQGSAALAVVPPG